MSVAISWVSCHIPDLSLYWQTNVLVDGQCNALLADVGIANILTRTIALSAADSVPPFAAPELHLPQNYGYKATFSGSPASDVFALAAVCFEVRDHASQLRNNSQIYTILALQRRGSIPET